MSYDLAVDTETKGLAYHDPAFLLTMAWRGLSPVLDPLQSSAHDLLSNTVPQELDEYLRESLHDARSLVFHNAKFDLQKLILAGLIDPENIPPFHDTYTQAHLLDEHQSKKLKSLTRTLLGIETDEDTALTAARKRHGLLKVDDYHYQLYLAEPDTVVQYALKDAEYTLLLHEYQYPKITGTLREKYEQELELTRVLLRMEAKGMRVDEGYVDEQIKQLGSDILRIKREIKSLTGREVFEAGIHLVPRDGETKKAAKERALVETFNPNSVPQIIQQFAILGVQVESTDQAAMAKVKHPLAPAISDLRAKTKLRSTYFKALKAETVGGIFHPSLRQHGTVTGRMSSGSESFA